MRQLSHFRHSAVIRQRMTAETATAPWLYLRQWTYRTALIMRIAREYSKHNAKTTRRTHIQTYMACYGVARPSKSTPPDGFQKFKRVPLWLQERKMDRNKKTVRMYQSFERFSAFSAYSAINLHPHPDRNRHRSRRAAQRRSEPERRSADRGRRQPSGRR